MKVILLIALVIAYTSCANDTNSRSAVNRPTDDYIALPSTKNLQYDSLNIVTTDGVRLTGWLIRPNVALADAVMIMAGGDAGNMSFALDYAGYMTNVIGVPILLFDYRGFGSSTDFSIDPDRLTYPEYVTDIEGVIDWTQRHHPNAKIILHGLSMGASLSLVAAARRTDVAAVIAESPYISQRTLVERVNAQRQQAGSGKIITYDGGESLDPITHVARLGSTPLLLIHGAKETKIPPDEARKFYDAYPAANKEMWLVPEAGHLEAMNVAGELYVEKIGAFVRSVTR